MLATGPPPVNPRHARSLTLSAPISLQALEQWFDGPVGRHLLRLERQHLDQVLPGLFGYHLVHVGVPATADLVESSRIHHRVRLATGSVPAPGAAALCAEEDRWPLASDSVDVVLLTHVLEFAANPHRVLREAERALIGEGHLVVVAFNPFSLWGAWKLALGWRRRPPWHGRFYSVARIRDWLALLDFEVVTVERFAFAPPARRLLSHLEWVEHLGNALWPRLGAAALIVARKRVLPLTPVRQRWQARRTLIASGLAEPSTRSACE